MTKVINIRTHEPYDVRIDRRTIYGNPFVIGEDGDREEVLLKFRIYFYNRVQRDDMYMKAVEGLRGKTLGCWCKPSRCHGDIYVEYLEGNESP